MDSVALPRCDGFWRPDARASDRRTKFSAIRNCAKRTVANRPHRNAARLRDESSSLRARPMLRFRTWLPLPASTLRKTKRHRKAGSKGPGQSKLRLSPRALPGADFDTPSLHFHVELDLFLRSDFGGQRGASRGTRCQKQTELAAIGLIAK